MSVVAVASEIDVSGVFEYRYDMSEWLRALHHS